MSERAERHRVPPATRAALLAFALIAAAAAPAAAQRLPFTRYTADDGLAATQVWDLLEDSRGYLWVATTWGLCRWDGERFDTFAPPEGLPSPTVRSLLEDRRGRIWIGTNNGLAVYDGTRIEALTAPGGPPPGAIWASEVDREGRLWFGSERGLVLFDGHRFRSFTTADGLASNYVYALHAAADGGLWIGSRGGGVTRCELARDGALERCRTWDAGSALGAGSVRAIAEDERGAIYLATRGGGLAVYADGELRRRAPIGGLGSDDLYALLVNRAGELVIGSADAGVTTCALPELGHCQRWREPNGLPDDGVRVLLEDREGTLWIGTEGGLASLHRRDLWSYGEPEGLPDGHVYALAADPGGGLWVGTFGGLAHLELGVHGEPTVEITKRAQGLPHDWIWALAPTAPGEVWVGTELGLCRWRRGASGCRFYTRAQGLPSDYVLGLHLDRRGDLWIGTPEGVARLADARQRGAREVAAFTREDGLAFNRSYAFAEDATGRLWVAHGEGLSWFDGTRFHAVGAAPGLASEAVRALGVDSAGDLWAGGYGFVARLIGIAADGPRFEHHPVGVEGEGALVLTIADDGRGHLLLGSNRGVLLYDPRVGGGEVLARFDRDAGAIATEVSHSSAFAERFAGRVWFGFKGGLMGFPTGLELSPEAPPALAFESLEAARGGVYRAPFSAVDTMAGRTLWLGRDAIELPPGARQLRATVRALTFRRERGMRFQFRLDGSDQDWLPAQDEPFRDFSNVDPGRHVVRARIAAGETAWGVPVELAFTIRPRLWEAAWFRALAALAAAATLLGMAGFHTRSVARRARELERKVAERTDDLARYARALAEHLTALDRGNELVRETDRQRRDLLAQLSHEVRTPLTSILGFSELLESAATPRLTGRELRYLANVRESGNHLLRLVNNLLDQAKLDAGRMEVHLERVDLAAVVASVVSLMEGFAVVREVRLEARPEGDLPPVEVDLAKLRQVLLNLLSNAIKFSPVGGLVVVEARALEADANPLGAPAFELAVRDGGPGIRAEDLPAIFEPFRQLDERREGLPGTGLGLPIARQLARLMGGDIRVDSAVGKGSVFRVLLPQTAASPAPNENPAAPPSGGRPRVLIVEPERAGFGVLARDLELGGFLAVRAPDVEEARRMMPELRPVAVAIDLDPARPEGWRAAASLERELLRQSAPLVLVARGDAGRQGWAIGFDRVLPAGAGVEDLVDALRAATEPGAPEHAPRGVLLMGGAAASAARRRALAEAGFAPIFAADALAASAALDHDRPAAVVFDAGDPMAGGFSLLRRAQAEGPGRAVCWLLITPEELSARARRLYTEEVEGAPEPAAAALATAVADAAERHARRRRPAAPAAPSAG